jgi:hypothetical protein
VSVCEKGEGEGNEGKEAPMGEGEGERGVPLVCAWRFLLLYIYIIYVSCCIRGDASPSTQST